MLNIDGFRLISINDANVRIMTIDAGLVTYKPGVKYKTVKTAAFDPTIKIRKGKYHEDTIDCVGFLLPEEYRELLSMLLDSTELYIEFDAVNKKQFPVEVSKYPEMTNDVRYCRDAVKFTLISTYNTLTEVDFSVYTIVSDLIIQE